MTIPFKSAPFKSTAGTVARTLDQRFGDVINVLEFTGVDPTGATDSSAGIQAALDAAFGSSASPHGLAGKYQNRPVFFPAGHYILQSQLNLTKIVGGHIYGASHYATHLDFVGATPAHLFNINGASGLTIERMRLQHHGNGGVNVGTASACVNLDWDGLGKGTNCDGLHHNLFKEMDTGGGEWVWRIGASNHEGNNNLWMDIDVNSGEVGLEFSGSQALNNSIIGGGGVDCHLAWVRCPVGGGSIHAQGVSTGLQNQTPTAFDYRLHSNQVHTIGAGRSETEQILEMSNGTVTMSAFSGANYSDRVVLINSGRCILEGCVLGQSNTHIDGAVGAKLYITACSFGASPPANPLGNFLGTKVWNPDGWT